MTAEEWVQQLMGLPDVEAQRRYLKEHVSLLDDAAANALKEQADRFLRADVQRSLEVASLIQYQAELNGNPLHRALGLLAEANARSIGLGEYERGLALYNEAAGIYAANGLVVRQARSQIGKLIALARLGRYDEALGTCEWAGRILEEHAQWRPLADLTLNLGFIQSRLGKDIESLAQYDRARAFYEKLGVESEHFLPWVDHDRAIALRNLGQFEASLQAAQRAMQTLAEQGQTVEAARARQNQALTYFMMGRYNEALVLYEQVRDTFLSDGRKRDAVLVDLFTCDCLLQLRRFADVLERCIRIRERFHELGTMFEAGQALLNEAVAYAGLGRHEKAMASLAEAQRVFAREGNEVWAAYTELERAALLLRQGRFEESVETAKGCTEIFRGYGLPVQEAHAHLIMARAMAALRQYDGAQQLVAEALAAAKGRELPSLTYQCYHLMGSLARAEGDAAKALAAYDQAIEELERLRGRLMVEFRADFLEDKQRTYEDVVHLCLDLGHSRQPLEYAERAKSRALLDLLAYRLDLSVRARTPADRPLVDELSRLRSERDRLYRRWEGREDSGEENWTTVEEERQRAQRDILGLEKQITDLWHRILIRNADYARDASLWQVRTEPIQPYLDPGTALLEYFVAHGELVAFVVTDRDVQTRRLPGDLDGVLRLIQLLWLNLKAVSSNTSSQTSDLSANAQGLLRRLYELLFAPLNAALAPYSHLIIVPHGPLHYLPFHALYDGESFLLDRHEISYLPAASLLRYCSEAQVADSGHLILGPSHSGRLPYAAQEAHSIAEILGDRALVEDEASLTRLRGEAVNCRLLHLAAHGEFRPDNPLFSGLVLNDGWLTTLDIFDMHLKASLVTLSACQTGRNVIGGGDEVQGLMRAFVHAGAASVVLTLWAVNDRSTESLMKAFYGKLADGWTKGAALRYAQRRLAAEWSHDGAEPCVPYAHPYFWAPFFLVGDAGPL